MSRPIALRTNVFDQKSPNLVKYATLHKLRKKSNFFLKMAKKEKNSAKINQDWLFPRNDLKSKKKFFGRIQFFLVLSKKCQFVTNFVKLFSFLSSVLTSGSNFLCKMPLSRKWPLVSKNNRDWTFNFCDYSISRTHVIIWAYLTPCDD